MYREESVEEISDGRYYTANDMVRIGTGDCRGCSDCCRMGPLIILDPLDVFELNRFLQQSFEELLNETIELKVTDGLILPVIKLVPESVWRAQNNLSETEAGYSDSAYTESNEPSGSLNRSGCEKQDDITRRELMICPYLALDGRCSIHEFRPGICRLYPLGRSWESGDFRYILQINECTHCNGTKLKVKKWLGIPDLASYESFCRDWHSILEAARRLTEQAGAGSRMQNEICIYLLKQFYLCDWNVDDFYGTFALRCSKALQYLGLAPLKKTEAILSKT